MPYPGALTFPSASLFPGIGGVGPAPAYAQDIEINLNGLILTATDSQGVDWMADILEGWYGSTASTLQLQQKPRAPGAWPSVSPQMTPRVITISGGIMAPTPAALEDAIARLNAAATIAAGTLTVTAHGVAMLAIAQRQDVVLVNRLSDYLADFSVQLSAPDPRKFLAPLSAITRLPTASGGWTIPFTFPLTIASTIVSGQCTLTNPGNTTGPVQLRIDGPCNGPVITHVGTGLSLVFASDLILGTGEWMDVDMEAQTVLANGQSSRIGYVTNNGWSGFEPGVNVWSFTAAGYSPLTKLTVTASPAYQ